jgi:hypothetical protein
MPTPKEHVLAVYPKAASSKKGTLWQIIMPDGPDPDDPSKQLIRVLGSAGTANLAWLTAYERLPELQRHDEKSRDFALNYGVGPDKMKDFAQMQADPPDAVATIDGVRHEIRHKLGNEDAERGRAQMDAYKNAMGMLPATRMPAVATAEPEDLDEAPVKVNTKTKKYRVVQYVEPKPQKPKGAKEMKKQARKAERQARKKNRRHRR